MELTVLMFGENSDELLVKRSEAITKALFSDANGVNTHKSIYLELYSELLQGPDSSSAEDILKLHPHGGGAKLN